MSAWPFTLATTSALWPRLHPVANTVASASAALPAAAENFTPPKLRGKDKTISLDTLCTACVSCILSLIAGLPGRRCNWSGRTRSRTGAGSRSSRRLLPLSPQRLVDHPVHELDRHRARQLLPIDKQRSEEQHV